MTVPKPEDAGGVGRGSKLQIGIPLICDIHFDYKMAPTALDHPVDKIRINPGGEHRPLFARCRARDKGILMRIGVNAGSLERDLCEKYEFPALPRWY
ncbi:MAG: flavodoxin-dependent (E)-4-hydroxy-3-methylbut-2-enyl-diphosphate synthase [Gemmataceae bacterium]